MLNNLKNGGGKNISYLCINNYQKFGKKYRGIEFNLYLIYEKVL